MTLVDLYKNRCSVVEGKYKPHFWIPKAIKYAPPSLYCDTKCPELWGINQILSRSLAVNKFLEDDGAGYFVGQALRNSERLPDHPIIKPLLQSNIKDEKSHQRGIDDLCDIYSTKEDLQKASELANLWRTVDYHHPLFPVAVLETAVFTPVLGFWRVFGGSTIADAAYHIAFDEIRHVKTNRSILSHLGYDVHNTPKNMIALVKETLAWIFEGLNVPENTTDFNWTLDNMIGVSNDMLVKDGSEQYNEVCFYGEYIPHFETNLGYGRGFI